MADWQPPVFVVQSVAREGAQWRIKGVCHDDMDLARVMVGDQMLLSGKQGTSKSLKMNFTVPVGEDAVLVAVDSAGNRLQMPVGGGVEAGDQAIGEPHREQKPRSADTLDAYHVGSFSKKCTFSPPNMAETPNRLPVLFLHILQWQ